MNPRKIALDYDGTFTADPELWSAFVVAALERGHSVTIVTYRTRFGRYDNTGLEADAARLGIPIVYTEHRQKRTAFDADIWIDDMPEIIPTVHQVLQWTDK